MKDDALTRGIAAALADEARAREDDAKWEALAKGDLTPGERAALEALAANDPSAADALGAYTPLGSAFEEQIAQSFLTSGAAASHVPPVQISPPLVASPPVSTSAPAAKAAPARSKLVRLGTYVAAPLALAAGIALLVGQRRSAGDALPPYTIGVSSDLRAERGDGPRAEGDVARIHPRAFFEIIARPSVPLREPIGARAVLVHEGRAAAWNVPIAISEEGAVRIAGRADALFPDTTGAYEIVVALAPMSALPDEEAFVRYAQGSASPPPAARLLRARVEIVTE